MNPMLAGMLGLTAVGLIGLSLWLARRAPPAGLNVAAVWSRPWILVGVTSALVLGSATLLLLAKSSVTPSVLQVALGVAGGMAPFALRRFLPGSPATQWTVVAVLLIAVSLWLVWPNWLTIDIAAVVLIVTLLLNLPHLSGRVWLWLTAGLIGYDVIHVFATDLMMEAIGRALEANDAGAIVPVLPVFIVAPESLHWSAGVDAGMGFGDIVLPGLIVLLGLRIGRRYGLSWFWRAPLIGYSAGMAAVMGMLLVFKADQPGLLYLLPGAVLGLLWAAQRSRLAVRDMLALRPVR